MLRVLEQRNKGPYAGADALLTNKLIGPCGRSRGGRAGSKALITG